MSAPASTGKTASRKTEAGRKAGKTSARAGSGTAKRGRSAAVERAYARREERRASTGKSSQRPRRQRELGGLRGPLRVVTPKAKQLQERISLSRVPFVVAVMVLMAVGLIATLWLSIAGVSGSYQLRQGKVEIAALSEQKEQLIRQNSYLDSTPALQRRATEWGWVPAPEPAHLVRDPSGAVRVVGDPEKAQAPAPPPPPPAPPAPPQGVQPVPPPTGPQAPQQPGRAAEQVGQVQQPQTQQAQVQQTQPAQVQPAGQQLPAGQQPPADQGAADQPPAPVEGR